MSLQENKFANVIDPFSADGEENKFANVVDPFSVEDEKNKFANVADPFEIKKEEVSEVGPFIDEYKFPEEEPKIQTEAEPEKNDLSSLYYRGAEMSSEQKEKLSRDLGAIESDLRRVVFRPTRSLTSGAINTFASLFPNLSYNDLSRKEKKDFVNSATSKVLNYLSVPTTILNYDWNNPDVIDEDGDIRPLETLTGEGANLAALIATSFALKRPIGALGSNINKRFQIQKTSNIATRSAPLIIGTEGSIQLFGDPDYNEFNVIKDFIDDPNDPDDAKFISLFAADVDDEEFEKRSKMLISGLGFSGVLGVLGRLGTKTRQGIFGKRLDEMSEKEANEAFEKYLTITRDKFTETDQGVRQVIDQNTGSKEGLEKAYSFAYKFKQKFFTSRGYGTPKLKEAMLNFQYSQRQIIARAENISLAIKNTLDKAGGDEKLIKKVNKILESDFTKIYVVRPSKRVGYLAKQRNIPEDVAEAVLYAKSEIDELSQRILNTKGFSKEIKESVLNNLNTYIRRNYRAFEDADYVPDAEAKETAIKYIYDGLLKDAKEEIANKGIILSSKQQENLFKKTREDAEYEIEQLLGKTGLKDFTNYTTTARKIGRFYQKDNTLAKPIRDLLQEIKSPSENVLLSISKAATIVETQNFYNIVNDIGKRKYIFGSKTAAVKNNKELYSAKIEGTGHKNLDGKYTTPEIAKFLNRQEETYSWVNANNPLAQGYRYYIGSKGFSQSMKTTYSHVTHARNIMGAYQFGIANGVILNPFNSETAYKVLKNKINKDGIRSLDDAYEEYLSLGVVSTSVNVNQFREMLKTGFDELGLYNKTNSLKDRTKMYDLVVNKPNEIYMATDDFAKIGVFEHEFKYLKEAFPNVDEQLLKRQAADIVTNTLPTYYKIPNGIKAMRNLPVGNFVAFPAEIIRTTAKMIQQAHKEIRSDNPVIRARGQERLAGIFTAQVGFASVAKASHYATGLSDEEVEARRGLSSGPFSNGHSKIYSREEETGKLWSLDTQYLNSYYGIQGIVYEFYDELREGKLKNEEITKILADATLASLKEAASPFLDQSIATGPALSLITAWLNESGKDYRNRRIFSEKGTSWDAIITELGRSFAPGSAISLYNLYEDEGIPALGIDPKVDPYTLKYKDQGLGMLSQIGIKWDEETVEILEDDFENLVKDFNFKNNPETLSRITVSTDITDINEDLLLTNTVNYKNQADLYINVKNAIYLLGPTKTTELLKNNGFSDERADYMLRGQFYVKRYSEKMLTQYRDDLLVDSLRQKDFGRVNNVLTEGEVLSDQIYRSLDRLPLDDAKVFKKRISLFEKEKDPNKMIEDFSERTGFNIGGEVSTVIPNAPIEPDERVNKLTGLPYNETAGTAYMDFDDPLRPLSMSKGGRINYVLGSAVKTFIKELESKKTKTTDKERLERLAQANKDSQETQRDNTVNTAIKAMEYLRELGSTGKVLDYGAGLGKNAKAINADATFEPFPKEGFRPTYLKTTEIPENEFDSVISTNVINVLPKELRDEAVLTIGKTLKPNGKAIIQTWDVGANTQRLKSKNLREAEEANSSRDKDGGKFQKGFTKDELKNYVDELLGENFTVSVTPAKNKIGKVSVLVEKKPKLEGLSKGGKVLKALKRKQA